MTIKKSTSQNSKNKPLANNQSQGSTYIKNFLERNKIEFIKEKKFDDCKYKNKLRFDFYLEKYNLLIEYDGKQHFKYNGDNSFPKLYKNVDGFYISLKKDQIKNNYAKKNHINFLRIPYKTYLDEIDKIINDMIEEINKDKHIIKFYNKYLYDIYKIME